MAKRPATNTENTNMSNEALDALADLGLSEAVNEAAETPAEANEEVNMPRDEVEIEIGTVSEIPVATRSAGGGGSRYPFAKLAAPSKNGFAQFTVAYKGGDEKKFKRSVQSATTQANRTMTDRYFESRSVTNDKGEFAGIMVIRTDNRPAKGE